MDPKGFRVRLYAGLLCPGTSSGCVSEFAYALSCYDLLASRKLAHEGCTTAAALRRPRLTRKGGGAAVAPAAHRGVLGSGRRARAPGGGAARGCLPAAGRRLCRDLRGLRIRPDRPQAQDPAADEPGAAAWRQEAGGAGEIGR